VTNPTAQIAAWLHDPTIRSTPDSSTEAGTKAMNSITRICIAATLSALAGYAQAAETVKPLQGVSFHTETKDAVVYYLADKGTCKVVLTLTDKSVYAPTRFKEAVEANKSIRHLIDDGKALEFMCHADARAMTINLLTSVAAKR
jgi:hypothetical protein